jgi:CheY-like chemotaxis protein
MRLELDPNATAAPTRVEQSGETHVNDSSVLLKKGISAAQAGDRELARKLLNEAVEADNACSDAWMWLASIAEYPEELLACLDHVSDLEPENPRALEWRVATMELLAKTFVQRGVAAHEAGDDAGAVDLFDKALSHDRDCETAWFWKGKLAMEDDMKVEFLRRVLSINPENTDASAILREVVESRLGARLIEAKKAAVAGNNAEALEMLEQVLDKDSRNVEAWMLRSHLSNDVSDKLHSLETVLIIDPDHAAARAGYEFLASAISVAPEEPVAEERVIEIEVEGTPEPALEVSDQVEQIVEPEMNDMIDPFKTIVGLNSDELMEVVQPVLESPSEESLDLLATAEDVLDATEIIEETEVDEYADRVDPDIATAAAWPADERADENEAEPWVAADEEAVAEVFEMAQEAYDEEPVAIAEEPWVEADTGPVAVAEEPYSEEPQHGAANIPGIPCPFCWENNDPLAFSCKNCHAALTLSDIESLISNPYVDRTAVLTAVAQMEAEWNLREFAAEELVWLAIGHMNLGNHVQGVKYLQEAFMLRPNDVILAGQINTLTIRLDEMQRQNEIEEGRPKGRTILVVDDSATVRKLISGKLEKSGHTVVCAVDGVEALANIRAKLPDLVLLDITMPKMDGYEVCRQIRSNPDSKDIPVVMISGKDGFFDKVRGRMAGTTAYITKPFGPETLMKALETYLVPEGADAPTVEVGDVEDEPVAV